MDIANALQTASDLLKDWVEATNTPEVNRLDVVIQRTHLIQCVTALIEHNWGYLSAITGLDHPDVIISGSQEKQWDHLAEDSELQNIGAPHQGYVEVLYHFCEGAAVVTLRVRLPHSAVSIPSVCSLIPSATLYERELIEMFGVEVLGTPNTDRLLLPDDWPKGVYPMRKDFNGFEASEPE
jgi:NADH:ubiquinone oxidoreductase subunit C